MLITILSDCKQSDMELIQCTEYHIDFEHIECRKSI